MYLFKKKLREILTEPAYSESRWIVLHIKTMFKIKRKKKAENGIFLN